MKKIEIVPFEKILSGNLLYDRELKRAPWEIKVENFARINAPELIEKTLQVIENDHIMLVLTSTAGVRYGNTILTKFDREILSIDRPLDFDEKSVGRFRIYFQDILGVWSFFEVETVSACLSSLCATYPVTLYRLQRRQYHRVEVPRGTRTVFWENNNLRDGGYVRDLSATGMLICTGQSEVKFKDKSTLNDIAIAIPPQTPRCREEIEDRIALPVIPKGWIVRSFRDSETNLICHGVSFEYDEESALKLSRCVEALRAHRLAGG
jgi:hypothetical protein